MLDAETRLLLQAAVKSLNSLESAVHGCLEALRELTLAAEEQQKAQPQIVVHPEVSLPRPVVAYAESEVNAQPGKDRRERIRLRLELGGLASALILAALTLCTLYQIKRQADSAQRQTGVMQAQLEATDRPWIKVDVGPASRPEPVSVGGATPDNPLNFDQNGQGALMFSRTLTNTGKSVANHVRFVYDVLAAGERDVQTPVDRQKRLCAAPATGVQEVAVFPDQAPIGNVVSIFQTNRVIASEGSVNRVIRLFIVGCATYDYPSAVAVHQTGFIYEVFGGKSNNGIDQLITVPMNRSGKVTFRLLETYAR